MTGTAKASLYTPQTNGKIERFWQIWDKECWQRQVFASWEDYDTANAVFMRRSVSHDGLFYFSPRNYYCYFKGVRMSFTELSKPILCLDFEGIIHTYASGWKGVGVILDKPVEGAFELIRGNLS